MKSKLIVFIFSLIFLFSCRNDKESEDGKAISRQEEQTPLIPPEFNSDSALAFIEAQVKIGPRVPNTPSHKATGDFLIRTLRRFGAEVMVQQFEREAFDGTKLFLRNIIASYNPDQKKRILLAAHWDTRPFADKDDENKGMPIAGANDGGSGVGILLEMARLFQKQKPNVGIDIILFDGEDYGEPEGYKRSKYEDKIYWCLGSQYWSKNLHKPGYKAYYGIVLDMVGAEGARFYQEGISMRYAPKIVKKVWSAAAKLGHGGHFIPQQTGMITDDHVFVNENAKIPTIDIIEYGPQSQHVYFGKYHHTHDDNLNILSRETLQAVGETVLYVVFQE